MSTSDEIDTKYILADKITGLVVQRQFEKHPYYTKRNTTTERRRIRKDYDYDRLVKEREWLVTEHESYKVNDALDGDHSDTTKRLYGMIVLLDEVIEGWIADYKIETPKVHTIKKSSLGWEMWEGGHFRAVFCRKRQAEAECKRRNKLQMMLAGEMAVVQ